MAKSDPRPCLSPLLTAERALAAEYRKRARGYELKSVPPAHAKGLLEQGWGHDKTLKTRIRLRRAKAHDERLEDLVWCLLYKLGYSELSSGRDFTVPIRHRARNDVPQRIAVLARDEETVVVVRCCSQQEPAPRSLSEEITAFWASKSQIAAAIRRHWGSTPKAKMVWIIATQNVVWSPTDRNQARDYSIHTLTEREIVYFRELASHLGHAARFQFLAEFLEGQKVPALAGRSVPALRGKLGGRKCYSFVTTPNDLLKIAFVNHRTRKDPQALPSYQRLMSRSRLRNIGTYIEGGGFFPTNLLVNFKTPVRFDPVSTDSRAGVTYGHLYLPDRYKSTWIIDGQHRLYGYSGISTTSIHQNLLVVAFEGLPIEDEANLFVVINREQKSVPRTLLDDLQGDLRWGSEDPRERIGAIIARLVGQMNEEFGQPLYNRVTRQGIRPTAHTCLTLPQLKIGLVRSGLLGRAVRNGKRYEVGPLTGSTDEKTVRRGADFLNDYLRLYERANRDAWKAGRHGYVCTNVGVQGLLLIAASIIEHIETTGKLVAKETTTEALLAAVEPYVGPILVGLRDGGDGWIRERFKVKYGTGGLRQCHFRLARDVRTSTPNFSPEGFAEWLEEQSEEKIERAETQLKELTKQVHSYVFQQLRMRYGDDYFERGVSNKQWRVDAYSRQQDDPQRLPLENYLELIQLKKIVENSSHWHLFKDVLNIPEKRDKGKAKNLGWLEKLNVLRRIPAHPAEGRDFRIEDFDYLDWIHAEFFARYRRAETKEQASKPKEP